MDRPVRVVLFGGGPYLEWGVKRFLCRLEAEPGITFLGGLFESQGQSPISILSDLWSRRRWLAAPVLMAQVFSVLSRTLRAPGQSLVLRRCLGPIRERLQFVPDIHAAEVLQRLRTLEPDLGLVYGSPILKPALFRLPRFGSLGIHHGKLPEYRGKKTTFWAMARGEDAAGVTIQRIGTGLDTGAVVKQGEVAIKGRSYRRVWEDVESLGIELFLAAVLETREGRATCSPPSGDKGTLYRDPKLADLLAFQWQQLSRNR